MRFYILNRKKAMSFLNKKVREGTVLKLHGYNLESFGVFLDCTLTVE